MSNTKWQVEINANGEMNYYSRLTDEQIKKLVAYAETLGKNEAFEVPKEGVA